MIKNTLFLLAMCLIAAIVGFLILNGSKLAFGIIALIFLAFILGGFILKAGVKEINKYMLYFIIASIPFPYMLQFLGRDALTLTTIMIYLLFIIIILCYFFERKSLVILKPRFAFILPGLILVCLTLAEILNPYFIGQSIKYYTANVSGILLYFIVFAVIKKNSEVITVIKIILFTLVLQLGIILLVFKYPIVKGYLLPFCTRVTNAAHDFTSQYYIVEGIQRFAGTIWDYELLAEWFLIGSILSIGFYYNFRRGIYIFTLFCCLTGIIFTMTRSACLLFVFGLALIFILDAMLKKYSKSNIIKLILLLFLGYVILFKIFPNQIDILMKRLNIYFQHSDIFSSKAINRKEVWDKVLYITLKKLKIFGNGLYSLESNSYRLPLFHSLYLSMLYKIGILGLFVHIIFWLKMLYESWNILVTRSKHSNYYIVFFLFISLILMLIDEIKIEYLRHGHTIQFAWLLYGLFNVSIKQSREDYENIMVS